MTEEAHKKCRICHIAIGQHAIIDTGTIMMLECPTGDRRAFVFIEGDL